MVLADNYEEINQWERKAFRTPESDKILSMLLFMNALTTWLFHDRVFGNLVKILVSITFGAALLYGSRSVKNLVAAAAIFGLCYDLIHAISFGDIVSIVQSLITNGIIFLFCQRNFHKEQMLVFCVLYSLSQWLPPALPWMF